jgi:ankyrin repeat protein
MPTNPNDSLDLHVYFWSAAEEGNLARVIALLANPLLNPNQIMMATGITPLHIAAQNGHIEVVNALLADPRVDPNQGITDEANPLCIAAQQGYIEIVNALLAAPRVDPNQAGAYGATPLYLAAQNGHIEIVNALLADLRVAPNQAITDGATPLFMAAEYGHKEVVIALLADSRVDPNQAMMNGLTPLIIAVQKGHKEVVSVLLADPRIALKQAKPDITVPPIIAAQQEHAEVTNASADVTPATLSLELAWKAKSTYWAGKIRFIDLYIDDILRYTVTIPDSDERATQVVSLPFEKIRSATDASEIQFLIVKNLDTLRKISLKAGIVNQKQGNIMSQNSNGTWSRDIRFIREDLPLDLDVSSLQLGKHYKMIVTHKMERTSPGSSYWEGDSLRVTLEENGPCRQTTALIRTPAQTTFFATPSSAASSSRDSLLPSKLAFKHRKENSSNPNEINFFTLALEEKYEEAIVYATNMDDQAFGGRMILDLLKHRDELKINVNTMNDNPLRQTPLHRAAIHSKWHAYYALVEVGANSYLEDSKGIPANEYRCRNSMTVFNSRAQHQILKDLFGDAAPMAEKWVDAVNAATDQCSIS